MGRRTTFSLVIFAGVLTSCDGPASTAPQVNHLAHDVVAARSPNAVVKAGLTKAVRAATARYHSTKQAEKDGYAADPVCVAVPGLGGMGHHWANGALVDDVFDPSKPEVVLYAPDRHGKLKLVAVEYIVIDVGQAAPTFEGQAFDVGGTPVPVSHWSLHVWLYEQNPSGIFTPFNPNITCP